MLLVVEKLEKITEHVCDLEPAGLQRKFERDELTDILIVTRTALRGLSK